MASVKDDDDNEVQDMQHNPPVLALPPDLCCIKEEIPDEEESKDDIKIEEHDVLGSPLTKALVLDLSSIKDEDSPGYTHNDTLHQTTETENKDGCEVVGDEHSFSDTKTNVDGEMVVVIDSIKDEAREHEEDGTFTTAEVNAFENITSSVRNNLSEEIGMKEVDIKLFKSWLVHLEDCGQILLNNPSFCKECKILFPTNYAFLEHDLSAHSLLAFKAQKKIKATAKVTSTKTDSRHERTNSCDQKCKNNETLKGYKQIKNSEHKLTKNAKTRKENTQPSLSTSQIYCCNICSYCFKFRDNITNHMSTNHSLDKNDYESKNEPLLSRCKFCSSRFHSIRAYNRHIKLKHKKMFLKNANKAGENISSRQKTTHNETLPRNNLKRSHSVLNDRVPSKNKLLKLHNNQNVTFSISKDNESPTDQKMLKNGRRNSTASMRIRVDSPTPSTNSKTKRQNNHSLCPSPKRKVVRSHSSNLSMISKVARRHTRTSSTISKAESHSSTPSTNDEAEKASRHSKKSKAIRSQSPISSVKDKAAKHHIPNPSTITKPNRSESPLQSSKSKENSLDDRPSQAECSQNRTSSKKIPKLWNILYRCSTCDITHDHYDYAVEHCQKHINKMESLGLFVQYCEICCLTFDSSCFNQHEELHAKNDIKKETFRIFSYNYELLLTKKWLNFLTLRHYEVKQILENSIYFNTRKVKMRLVKDGHPESTIFKCCKCMKYVNPRSVFIHSQTQGCYKHSSGLTCNICSLEFSTDYTLSEHLTLHEKFESFKIVYFNEKGDESFNEKLFLKDSELNCEFITNKNIHYYRCRVCQRCVYNELKRNKHACGSQRNERCEKCDLLFMYGVSYHRHLRLHQLNPQLSRQHIIVSEFTPKSKRTNKKKQRQNGFNKIHRKLQSPKKASSHHYYIPKHENINNYNMLLFRCDICEAHFTRRECLLSHLGGKKGYHKFTGLAKCDICQYSFSKTRLRLHRHFHHRILGLRRKDFVIMTSQGSVITSSEVVQNKDTDLDALETNHSENTSKVLTTDESVIEGNNKSIVNKNIYVVENLNAEADNSQSDVKVTNKTNMQNRRPKRNKQKKVELYQVSKVAMVFSDNLFRCEQCNLNFMLSSSLKYHLEHSCDGKTKSVTCGKCDLLFDRKTFSHHFKEHHIKLNLTKDDIKILNLNYELIVDEPKIRNACEKDFDDAETSNDLDGPEISNDFDDSEILNENTDIQNSSHQNIEIMRRKRKRHSEPEIACEKDFDNAEISNDSEILNENTDIQKASDIYLDYSKSLFKCHFCGLHYLDQNSLVRHECQFLSVARTTCDECDLEFDSDLILRHKFRHHQRMGLKLEDFEIFVSGRDIDKTNNHPKKSIHIPGILRRNNKPKNQSKIEISKVVAKDNGLTNKTADSQTASDEIEKLSGSNDTRRLFRCHFCGLHYLGHDSFVLHECRFLSVQRTDCEDCGLEFSTEIIAKHRFMHHSCMGLKLQDFEIVQM